MFGAIQAGGVIQTVVTVESINGYNHTVSLSASGQPSGITVGFERKSGEAKPSYKSNVLITVNSNVSVGGYSIKIKGTGADGKVHSCDYTLSVERSVTQTPTSSTLTQPTATSSPTVTVISTPTLLARGYIIVSSEPPNAKVYLDDEYEGKTPDTITADPSRLHTLKLYLEGYKKWSDEVQVNAGETLKVHAKLTSTTGSIYVTSEPSDATIYLDGSNKGKTPDTITEVSLGHHTIKLSRDGYRNWSKTVEVTAGETLPVDANLTQISTPPPTLQATHTPIVNTTHSKEEVDHGSLICPTIKITNPKDGDTVFEHPIRVCGTVENFTIDEQSLWVCARSFGDIWYPQKPLNMTGETTWEAKIQGVPLLDIDIDKRFNIVVLVATKEVDKVLKKAFQGEGDIYCQGEGDDERCWGLTKLPEGATNISDNITITRDDPEVRYIETHKE
jgi:hypothetical protein